MHAPLPSVSDIHRCAWNTPSAGVAGVISRLFAPIARGGWALQNGRLRDPDTGTEIEFMLSKRERFLDPSTDVHKWIEIRAAADGQVVWKSQEPRPNVNRGKPFAKLEVEREATVTVLDRRPGPPDLFSAAQAAASSPPPAAAPSGAPAPATPPDNITPMPPPSPASAAQPDQAMRRLGALYVLSREQALEALRLTGLKEPTPQDVHSATGLIYVQASRDGLHLHLDPDKVTIARDPEAAKTLQPNLHNLRQLAEGREATLNLLLIGSGILKVGQSWQDLDERQAAAVIAREEIVRVLKAS